MNKLLSASFLLLTFFSSSVSAQQTFWNKIFLYYPLNGNTLDYSGNNFHGNSTSLDYDTGIFNDQYGAAKLNGVNSHIYRQFLNLPDSSSLTGWYYSESDSQSTALIYNGNTGLNGYGVFIKKPFGTVQSGYLGKKIFLVQGGISENTFNGIYNCPKNQWVHLALVRRSQIFELYIDGIFQTSGIINANPPTSNFCLGSSPEHIQAGYPSFLGKIDEVILFNTALLPQEVQLVYNANLTEISKLHMMNRLAIIYPNPSKNTNIQIKSTTPLIEISLSNILGSQILSTHDVFEEKYELDTKCFQKGIYILTIRTKNNIQISKIEIQ